MAVCDASALLRAPTKPVFGGAGTQRGDCDAAVPGLVPQRLAEGQHERLRSTVGGLVGGGLERDSGGDVQHAATPALDHAGQNGSGEPDKSSDVNADDVHLSRGVGSVE